ncbi:MAG: AmpG family muropeptide MFS transporter [Alphaproteobacteria bacterium]
MRRWLETVAIYRDPRLVGILFLGFSSGLPRGLVGATLAAWLTEAGVSMTAIGLVGMVAAFYSLKFLWAPVMDQVPVPFLTRRLGRRRSWTLVTQVGLVLSLLALGLENPAADLTRTVALAIVVAICSASQDIVIDAYRVEVLREEQYGAGAAMVQFGYNMAMLVTGFGSLYLAQFLSWYWVYPAAAALVTVGMITVLVNPEPPEHRPPVAAGRGVAAWLRTAVAAPFLDMVERQGWSVLLIFAFVLLYKVGDSFAGAAATPFYLKIGFSKVDIANVSKLFGVAATIIGTMVGGAMVARLGIMRALLVCGVLQMLSNLTFAYLASVGAHLPTLYLAIAAENVTGGMGSAAFVAYLSGLCNLTYTGTQYALLSSIGTLTRNTVAATWGGMVDHVGWVDFFLFTTVAALPGLILLLWMMRRFPMARMSAAE